jgi:hypothetical protein
MTPELQSLLRDAAQEIRDLRQQRDLLRAKVEGFELAGALLFAKPQTTTQGMSVDVAWQLDRAIAIAGAEPT